MINQQIKSHWKLAGNSFWKAIKVTLHVCLHSIKAKWYIINNNERLMRERNELNDLIFAEAEKLIDKQ